MKKLSKRINRFFSNSWNNFKNNFKAVLILFGAIFGIKRISKHNYNLQQILIGAVIFILSSPLVIIFFGNGILSLWAGIILTTICLINVDEVMMLTYLFAEFGVEEVLLHGDYRKWIQDIYSYTSSQESSPV